jgi:cysteine desulfurase
METLTPSIINLDAQGCSPLSPAAATAMAEFQGTELPGMSASVHRGGVRARELLGKAREAVSRLFGAARAGDIVFTSGGTEAAHLALWGGALAQKPSRRRQIVANAIEHPAVLRTLDQLKRLLGFRVVEAGVDGQGRVLLEHMRAAVGDDTAMVVLHWVHHDLGVVQDIAEVSAMAKQRGAVVVVDAAAGAGFLPLDVEKMGVDMAWVTSHRFGGPRGTGALYLRRGVPFEPVLLGGDQENGWRAGTENMAGIVGMAAAAGLARESLVDRSRQAARLQDQLLARLESVLSPCPVVFGPRPGPGRAPHLLALGIPGLEAEAVALALDLQGVLVHAGASCMAKSQRISPALKAIGISPSLAKGGLLLSPCLTITDGELDRAIDAFHRVVERLRRLSPVTK